MFVEKSKLSLKFLVKIKSSDNSNISLNSWPNTPNLWTKSASRRIVFSSKSWRYPQSSSIFIGFSIGNHPVIIHFWLFGWDFPWTKPSSYWGCLSCRPRQLEAEVASPCSSPRQLLGFRCGFQGIEPRKMWISWGILTTKHGDSKQDVATRDMMIQWDLATDMVIRSWGIFHLIEPWKRLEFNQQEWWPIPSKNGGIIGILWGYNGCTVPLKMCVCIYIYILWDMGGMCVSMYLCVFSTNNTHIYIYV